MNFLRRIAGNKKRPGVLTEWRRIAMHDLWNRHLFMYASALAFNFVIVSLPLAFLLLLSLAYHMPPHLVYESLSDMAIRFLEHSGEITDRVRELIQSRVKNILTSISVNKRFVWSAVLFLTVMSYYFLSMVRSILNELWDIKGWQSVVRGTLRDMLAFGLLGCGVLGTFFIVIVLGLVFQGHLRPPIEADAWFTPIWFFLPVLIPLATMSLSFLMYYFLPSKRPSARLALGSAVSFGLLWELSRYLFGYYVTETFLALDALYGILAILLVGATWSYYSFFIFTVAAVLGFAYERANRASERAAS
ncbi:MAG: YihY/virulence factor BrkB family protein [Deltaproteobacteria bacterium]|nr:YihY/virulence factor BrkB family protein [Deltaproteobacteria bacterium]